MEPIICEQMYFYHASGKCKNTCSLVFRMKDSVNGQILQRAATLAMKRFPYYAVCCISDGKQYYLKSNDEVFVVRHAEKPVNLGGKEAHGYLLAINYWENKIYVNAFHGLTDGKGLLEFSRTLLYYYCLERYDSAIDPGYIRTNENVTEEGLNQERYNPYVDIMNGKIQLPTEDDILIKTKLNTAQPAFNILNDPRVTFSKPMYYNLCIPEKELMQYCHLQDGTPGVVISLLMSRAVDRLNPDNELPIITGMAISLRPALNQPLYKGSALAIAYLPYGKSIKGKSFDMQATIYRGRLILASDNERLQAGINSSRQLYSAVNNIPTIEGKKQMIFQVVNRYHNTSTFQVSYMGRSNFGSLSPYIEEVKEVNDTVSTGLTIEIMEANGYFFLEFSQEWTEDLYFNAFCQELADQGISYKILDRGEQIIPDIELP